jgi:multiple sugar transport system ATP-binding protein
VASGIELDALRKEFAGGVVAVDDLTLEIAEGEFMVLVGPSGCGKSTTLRMVAGLEEVSAGRIRIGGRDVTDLPPRKRDIAMVFQSYALYAHMSVRDNIGFGLKMASVPKPEIRDKVDEAAQVLGMTDLLDRKPRQLSGGQRQRVAMGRAIVREPTAFLMDEPLSNLDAKLRVEMRGEITSLQRRIGTPTLYVTHDQTEAMTMGDRVAILRDGVLEQLGTPAELYERPVNMFVASFIGSPAMNLIEGRCEADAGAPVVRFGESRLAIPDAVASRCTELSEFVGREICVGIRPEDFVAASEHGAEDSIEVHITRAESLGAELFVYFQAIGTAASPGIVSGDLGDEVETPALAREALTARLDRGSRAEPGSRARITVDTSRLYFFDPETGRALT